MKLALDITFVIDLRHHHRFLPAPSMRFKQAAQSLPQCIGIPKQYYRRVKVFLEEFGSSKVGTHMGIQ